MRSNYRCTSFDMDQTSAFISSLASPCNFNLKADKRSTSPRNCLWQLRLNWPLRFFRAREQMQAVPTKKEMRALTLAGLCLSSCGTATAGGCDSASCPPVGSSSLNVSMIAFSHGCADSSLELASVIRCYSWSIIETLEYLKALWLQHSFNSLTVILQCCKTSKLDFTWSQSLFPHYNTSLGNE